MIFRNRISLFVATFIIIGFFFLALPEKGFSGTGMTPIGCCQLSAECFNVFDIQECTIPPRVFNPGEVCNDGRECTIPIPTVNTNVPTLSEWGLIAMAGVLGIVGFIAIRRRKIIA